MFSSTPAGLSEPLAKPRLISREPCRHTVAERIDLHIVITRNRVGLRSVCDRPPIGSNCNSLPRMLPPSRPHFRHSQGSVDLQAIQGTPGDVNLDDEVRRGVGGRIIALDTAHAGIVRDVKTLVGFQPAGSSFWSPRQGHRAEGSLIGAVAFFEGKRLHESRRASCALIPLRVHTMSSEIRGCRDMNVATGERSKTGNASPIKGRLPRRIKQDQLLFRSLPVFGASGSHSHIPQALLGSRCTK